MMNAFFTKIKQKISLKRDELKEDKQARKKCIVVTIIALLLIIALVLCLVFSLHSCNTDTAIYQISVSYGEAVDYTLTSTDTTPEYIPANPTKTGYNFVGWYLDTENSQEFNFSDFTISSNITVYAKWEICNYTISFDANGAEGSIGAVNLDYGTEVTLPTNNLTYESFTFAGWSTTAKGDVIYTDGGKYICNTASDIVLYAVWESDTSVYSFELLENNTYTITSYDGSYANLTLPLEYNGLPVTEIVMIYNSIELKTVIIPEGYTRIGDSSFAYCSSLEIVYIPSTVTSIEDTAFAYDIALTNIFIDDDNTFYKDTDGVFYDYAGTRLICYPAAKSLTSYIIAAGTTSLELLSFAFNEILTEIILPESLISIGNSAFYGCINITEIYIPKYVTAIGTNVFTSCIADIIFDEDCQIVNLTSKTFSSYLGTEIILSDNIESIGDECFRSCVNLTSINIPASLETIGNMGFYQCSLLSAIELPDTLTSIGNYAFCFCTSLTTITIPRNVTVLLSAAFANCGALETVILERSAADGILEFVFGTFDSAVLAVYVHDQATLDAYYTLLHTDSLSLYQKMQILP